MKNKKKIIITVAVIILVIVLVIAAIMLLKSDTFGMNATQRKKAVAVVGTEKVTANELAVSFQNYYSNIDNYNMYALYYGYGTYHDVSTPEGVEALKKEILDDLIEERAYVAMAAEYGITLSAEEKAQCKADGAAAYDDLVAQYTDSYAKSGYSDPKSYAVSTIAQYFSNYGIGTKSEYVRRSTYSAEAALLAEKVNAKLKEESGITEADAEALYPDWASYYEGYYSEGMVATYDSYFMQGYQKIRYLYIPENFVFLRVITLTDEARAAELAAEIGTDAEKFETYCMSEENQDGLMPLIAADDSYAISANDSSFDPAVYEAVAAMNVGDITLVTVDVPAEEPAEGEEAAEAAPTKYFYIVRRVEGNYGIAPFEKVKDTVAADVIEDAQSKFVEERVHAWIAEEGHVVTDDAAVAAIKAK